MRQNYAFLTRSAANPHLGADPVFFGLKHHCMIDTRGHKRRIIVFERNLILFDYLIMKRLSPHLAESNFSDPARRIEFLSLRLSRLQFNRIRAAASGILMRRFARVAPTAGPSQFGTDTRVFLFLLESFQRSYSHSAGVPTETTEGGISSPMHMEMLNTPLPRAHCDLCNVRFLKSCST